MAPEPHRGKVAQPAMIPLVAKKVHTQLASLVNVAHRCTGQVAELKGLSLVEVIQATTENARTMYSLPK